MFQLILPFQLELPFEHSEAPPGTGRTRRARTAGPRRGESGEPVLSPQRPRRSGSARTNE